MSEGVVMTGMGRMGHQYGSQVIGWGVMEFVKFRSGMHKSKTELNHIHSRRCRSPFLIRKLIGSMHNIKGKREKS